MRDRLDELGDAAIVLITFTRTRNLKGYRARLGLPFPVLADEDRAVYRAYGLGRGSVWRVYGWRTLRRYWQLLRQGRELGRPSEDTLQLGGDFVVAPDGTLAYAFRSTGPDDRPEVDDLIRVVGNLRP